jgi:hypothetical protein
LLLQVPNHDANQARTSKKTFKSGSPPHKEFITLCETMKWNDLPRSHKELKKFIDKYGYNRGQLRRKFNEWKAQISGMADTDVTIDHSCLDFVIPETPELLEEIKKQESFLHMCAIAGEESIMAIIDMTDTWESVRTHVINILSESLIGVKRFSQWKARARTYAAMKTDFIANFPKESAPYDDNAYDYISIFQSLMYPFVSLIEKSATTTTTGSASMRSLVSSCTDTEAGIFPDDQTKLEKLYYVSGWLLRAAEMESLRRNEDSTIHQHLVSVVELGEVSDEAELAELPAGEVTQTDAFGGLKLPNQVFFTFVAAVENTCATCLTANNVITFGPYIVKEMKRELIANCNVQSMIRECCLVKDNEDVSQISEYLVRTYMRMRGKDYVRRVMSSSRRSRSTQHRHEQAALSNPKLRINKKTKKKTKKPVSVSSATNNDDSNDTENESQGRIMHAIIEEIVQMPEEECSDTDDDDSDDGRDSD